MIVDMTLRMQMLVFSISLSISFLAAAQAKPRARQSGVPLEGTPGPLNAITDVAGVEVGHRTLISGTNVRTGVTAVWPRGKASSDPVFRRLLLAERQRRHDRHALAGGIGLPGWAGADHQHAQRRGGSRRLSGMAGEEQTEARNECLRGRFLHLPHRGRNVRRLFERHQRISCEARGCGGGTGFGGVRSRGGRQRGRRHRHGVLWLQGRHRHIVAQDYGREEWIHRGSDGAVQLREPQTITDRRTAGGRGPERQPSCGQPGPSLSRRHGLHHHRGGYGCTAAAAPGEATGAARDHGPGADRFHIRQRIGRYLHRLFHRQPARGGGWPDAMSPCCRTTT